MSQEGGSEPRESGREWRGGLAPRPSGTTAPQRITPFSFMRRFSEEMDRLFEDFMGGRAWLGPSLGEFSPSGFGELGQALWSPEIEVFRRGQEMVIRADLPGLRKEDIQIEFRDDNLILRGQRTREEEEEREGVYRSERSYGSFLRTIPLPEGIDPGQARASYRDGVLEISLPTPSPVEKGKRIRIE